MGCSSSRTNQAVRQGSEKNEDTPGSRYSTASTALISDGKDLESAVGDVDEWEGNVTVEDETKLEVRTLVPIDHVIPPTNVKQEEQPGPVRAYFRKFAGAGVAGPSRPAPSYHFFSFLGAFVGIAVLGLVHMHLPWLPGHHQPLLVGSFGAMAVLLFSAPDAPPSQPKNAIFGNMLGAGIGVVTVKLFALAGMSEMQWLAAAIAVSFTIALQEQLCVVHPPGGATALLYVIIPNLHIFGFEYLLRPALLGTLILVGIALVTNNLSQARSYPSRWGWESPPPAEQEPPASAVGRFLRKVRGRGVPGMPRPSLVSSCWSLGGSFFGIAVLGLTQTYVLPLVTFAKLTLFIGSWGAMAVLLFSLVKSPLAQPKNTILGNTIGGIAGVLIVKLMEIMGLGHMLWLSGALAVATAIVLQELLTCVHPPGGATAIIFAIRTCATVEPLQHSVVIYQIGHWYVLCPALLGAVMLVCVAVVWNNLPSARSYPQGWL